jgi:hypothetical protein
MFQTMKNSRDWSWLPCSAESTMGDDESDADALRIKKTAPGRSGLFSCN